MKCSVTSLPARSDPDRRPTVDFTYTEEQEQLRSTLFSALRRNYSFAQRQDIVASEAGWSPAVWDQLTELGLPAIPFSEEVGGLDGSIVDLVAVAEIFGGYLVAEPWIPSTVLAGGVLAEFTDLAEARSLLEQIAAGEVVGALAHEEDRKSTRLNSSHVAIPYAVLYLKTTKQSYHRTV